MNSFKKVLALGAVVAASSSLAFADQISVNGYGSYTSSTVTFTNTGASSDGDTGIFTGLNGGKVTFAATPVTFTTTPTTPTLIFTVKDGSVTDSFYAESYTPTSPTGSFTPTNSSNSSLNDLGISALGYITGSGVTGDLPATLTITSQDESLSSPLTVSLSATAMTTAVTPEPNSLILMGTGLIGAAGMLFMRRRNANSII